MNDMINNFETTLKENGYKLTVQRRVILNLLIEHEEKHLSTEEIYDLVKKKYPQIGLATVYRTLMLFDKLGLIYKLDFDDGFSRYELNTREAEHRHHHLICTQCANVEEVWEDLLDSIEEEILGKNGFLVKDHRVKFYGLCKHCRKDIGE